VNNLTLPVTPSVAVVDVSFISLKKILVHITNLLSSDAIIYALVKPQFEAGREHINKGGIVKDPAIHEMVIEDMKRFAEDRGLAALGATPSPILGAKGNVEFLMAMRKSNT
jgi:23S rRNA (cytidine1920-2'-O)/16S rRNA (cytidine1409-2'-O)-methyltransferase